MKHYLDTEKFVPGGIPGTIAVYQSLDGATRSLDPDDIPTRRILEQLEVKHDEGGPFVEPPVDASTINGLSDLLV